MPLVHCPNCRATVDVDREWIGEEVRCPECEADFVATLRPERPAERPRDEDDDRPRRRSRSEDKDEEDDRPRRRRKRKSGGGTRTLLIVLGVVGLLVVLACGGGFYFLYATFGKPMEFAVSDWKEQTLHNGRYAVQMPATPRDEPIPGLEPPATGKKLLWDGSGKLKDAAFMFAYIDTPAFTAPPIDTLYKLERDETMRAAAGRVTRETTLTVEGHPAKEFTFTSGRTSGIYRMVYIRDGGKVHFVMIMVAGASIRDADQKKFVESFKIKR